MGEAFYIKKDKLLYDIEKNNKVIDELVEILLSLKQENLALYDFLQETGGYDLDRIESKFKLVISLVKSLKSEVNSDWEKESFFKNLFK